MTCFCFYFKRKQVTSQANLSSDINKGISNTKVFTYKELKNATDDFSESQKIGEGGFGPVYKAQLKDGRFAAVKVLSAESTQGVGEFLTEINLISEIQHENLVKLYGCCVEDDHRILVYNYLENNSLAQTLLGRNLKGIKFSWKTRLKICIGVARGLAYLHDEIRPRIVHRDIKASNILLDTDLTPKISDFGLAKLIPDNMTHISTRVAGTLGYLAPEYAINGRLTRKADVYSYGVLLVEIVCGRCNTNARLPVEEQNLLETIWEHFERGKLVELVDTSLKGEFNADDACRILKIGLLCTQENPKVRPSMSAVVKMLMENAVEIEDDQIRKPVLISDFMELKVRPPKKSVVLKEEEKDNSKNNTISSSSSSSYNYATTSTTIGSENQSYENSAAITATTNTGVMRN